MLGKKKHGQVCLDTYYYNTYFSLSLEDVYLGQGFHTSIYISKQQNMTTSVHYSKVASILVSKRPKHPKSLEPILLSQYTSHIHKHIYTHTSQDGCNLLDLIHYITFTCGVQMLKHRLHHPRSILDLGQRHLIFHIYIS